MRGKLTLIFGTLLLGLVGCETQPPPVTVETNDNRALRPSTRTFGYSDADVEAMRQRLAAITYPVPRGETVRRLGVQLPPFSSLEIGEYAANADNLAAVHTRRAPLNGRYELVIVEHQYVGKNRSVTTMEQSAEIRRLAP